MFESPKQQVPFDNSIDRRTALTALAGIGLSILAGYDQNPNPRLGIDEILEVKPHHATRIIIVYRDSNGEIYEDSTHHSATVKDKNVSLHPSDFLDGLYPYGKFDAVKYKEFRTTQNKPGGGD